MDKQFWKDAWETVQRELQELRDDRDERMVELEEINSQIVQRETLADHIAPFIGKPKKSGIVIIAEGIAELTLANAIREVLKQSDQYRTARGVRDSLAASGYDLNQHNNAIASVHGVLKRLAETGDVEQLEVEGKTRYRWKGQPASLPTRRHRVQYPNPDKPVTGFSGVTSHGFTVQVPEPQTPDPTGAMSLAEILKRTKKK